MTEAIKGAPDFDRIMKEMYAPQRWCDDNAHGYLCLVWIQ